MNFFYIYIVGDCSNYNNKLIIQSTLKETKMTQDFYIDPKRMVSKKATN